MSRKLLTRRVAAVCVKASRVITTAVIAVASSGYTALDHAHASFDAAAAARQSVDPPRPYEVVKKGLERNNYPAPLLDLRAREAEYLSSRARRSSFLQYMSYLTGWVGDYEESYRYEEMFLSDVASGLRKSFAKELESSPIDNYRPRRALDAIRALSPTGQ